MYTDITQNGLADSVAIIYVIFGVYYTKAIRTLTTD